MKLIRHVASFFNVDGAAGADSSRNLDRGSCWSKIKMNKQWYESLQYLYLFGKGMVVLQIKLRRVNFRARKKSGSKYHN